jgi:peptidoglycan/LPS O-acetylase OafA/YrhL
MLPLTKAVTLHQADGVRPTERVRDPRPLRSGFRTDIEGLRAVAVLAVVLFHASVPGIGGGFIGVDVFFVISGFLITGLLWREVSTAGTVGLRGFYGARARRLLPASAVVGVITAIGSAVLLPPLQAKTVMGDGIASALYVSNYRFVLTDTDYFSSEMPPSPFLHYWSLGVEEQFYLVWPALIIGTAWLVRRKFPRTDASSERPYLLALALVAAVSFALSLAATQRAASVAFFSLPTRAWELAVGGLVALTAGQWRRIPAVPAAVVGWAGLAVVLLACARLNSAMLYPYFAALCPVLGTALIIGAGCAAPAHGVERALSLPPLRIIGRVSYSWYLWHWPVLLLAPPLLGHPLGLFGRVVAVIVSGGLAALTLRLVENPFRFFIPVRRSATGSLVLGGAVTAVAVSTCLVLLLLIPTPTGRGPAAPLLTVTGPRPVGQDVGPYDAAVARDFAQVQAAVAASAELKAVPSNLNPPLADAAAEKPAMLLNGCLSEFFVLGQPECAAGDTASKTTVALVGDSNATMWAQGLDQAAKQRRWRLEILGKAGCPPMNLPISNPHLHREYTECEQWRSHIITRLQAERPALVVLSMKRHYGTRFGLPSGFTSYDPAWLDSITRLVLQLRGFGAKVLVLGPIPDPHSVVPMCLSGHLGDPAACSSPKSVAVSEADIAAETAATEAGEGQYADVTPLLCTAERCPVIVGNTLAYFDRYHLTIDYSRVLGPVLGALADRTLARG